MGGAKGQYECIFAFIREDYSEDLTQISVPVLVMNGEADQIVPYATSGPSAVELVQRGALKAYPGFPHGMPTTTQTSSMRTCWHSSSPDRSSQNWASDARPLLINASGSGTDCLCSPKQRLVFTC